MRYVLALGLLAALLSAHSAAIAEEISIAPPARPEDHIAFSLSAEDWVTTKTARVTINVEAAVSAANAGTMHTDMQKAVNDMAKADWRLTNFNRSQDQTGLDRWSASFEARLPENELNGLNETAKKSSKAGMQLSVGDVDFTPTLAEMEAGRAGLRTQLYKIANDQMAAVNNAMPGRTYRISMLTFSRDNPNPVMQNKMARAAAAPMASDAANPTPSMEQAQKIVLTANVVLATQAPPPAALPAPPPPTAGH